MPLPQSETSQGLIKSTMPFQVHSCISPDHSLFSFKTTHVCNGSPSIHIPVQFRSLLHLSHPLRVELVRQSYCIHYSLSPSWPGQLRASTLPELSSINPFHLHLSAPARRSRESPWNLEVRFASSTIRGVTSHSVIRNRFLLLLLQKRREVALFSARGEWWSGPIHTHHGSLRRKVWVCLKQDLSTNPHWGSARKKIAQELEWPKYELYP